MIVPESETSRSSKSARAARRVYDCIISAHGAEAGLALRCPASNLWGPQESRLRLSGFVLVAQGLSWAELAWFAVEGMGDVAVV